jgi:hypothetical protein
MASPYRFPQFLPVQFTAEWTPAQAWQCKKQRFICAQKKAAPPGAAQPGKRP